MKKVLLTLIVAMLSVVGAWAQFYKFTDAAQGRLYTSADESADPADTPKGAVCDKSYYVKSDYTLTTAPDKTELQTFSTKQYFVYDGVNYTSAYGQEYDVDKTYATVNGNKLEGEALTSKLTTCWVFANNGDGEKAYRKVGDNYVMVQVGDECNLDETYYWGARENGTVTGQTIKDYGMLTEKQTFISTEGIYVKDGDVYVAITSKQYNSSIEYYTLSYTDLTDDEETAMAANSANFDTKYVVTGLSDPSGIFYYNAGAYTEVHNGDVFLGDDKYYVPGSSFTLRTPAELLPLGFVYPVTGLVTLQPDGKTLNIICSGDVCDPGDEFSTEGYKFAQKAVNTIYPGEVENSVKENDIYNENQEYYTRAQKYIAQDIPTTTKYQLLQPAYVNNGGRYDFVNAGTDINDGAYYSLENEGTEYTEPVSTTPVYKFNDSANGWVYVKQGEWSINGITVGGELDPSTEYIIANGQGDPWNKGYTSTTYEDLKNGSYVTPSYYVSADPVLYTIEGTSYVPAAGTVYDEAKKYYSGVSFATIDNIKDNTVYATPVISVNPGATEYFVLVGETYTKVNAGETYDADKTYYIKDGYDYFVIAPATLISDSYMTSATVANNYWQAMANEINAAGYETVVFATRKDDTEKATICKNVTQAMMTTTTVNALDFLDVQIDEIKSPDNVMTTEPEGTFVYPNSPYTTNNTITILLLPEIKNEKSNGHRHVPAFCARQLDNLQLVVMPNNATCIEHEAFSNKATINQVILNDGLKMIGHDAFDAARLNILGIPESMEYIGKDAFKAGYLHDVYFYGKTAPIVERDAFGSKAYVDNDSYIRPSNTALTGFDPYGPGRYDPENWRLDRSHYISNDYMMTMLHLRTDLTKAERAHFTDVSRDFHVFDLVLKKDGEWVTVEEASPLKSSTTLVKVEGDENKHVSIFWDGTENKSTKDAKQGSFPLTAWNNFDLPQYNDHQAWENVTAYYDKTFGHQYTWPNQACYSRSYSNATNNLLWDGLTSIAEGIQSYGGTYNQLTYDSDCDGTQDRTFEDGNEYIGLHQFVLVTTDVSPETTPQEWDFHTLGGKNWYTICVPLDMTVAEVRKAFGDKTQVCKFSEVERKSDDQIKLFFTDEQCLGKTDLTAKAIKANEAYMIRPSEYKDADHTFTLPQYTIDPTAIPIPTVQTCTDPVDGKVYTYTFKGNYLTQADGTLLYMQKYSYYLGEDPSAPATHRLFFQVGEIGKWKPYTCIVIPSDGQADNDTFFDPSRKSKAITCSLGTDSYEEEGNGGITTVIKYDVVCGSENAPIYNLNGQFVGNNLNKLSRGVYVQNGKKFIVNK